MVMKQNTFGEVFGMCSPTTPAVNIQTGQRVLVCWAVRIDSVLLSTDSPKVKTGKTFLFIPVTRPVKFPNTKYALPTVVCYFRSVIIIYKYNFLERLLIPESLKAKGKLTLILWNSTQLPALLLVVSTCSSSIPTNISMSVNLCAPAGIVHPCWQSEPAKPTSTLNFPPP